MAIKQFNFRCSSIPSGDTFYSTEDEAHLHCLLKVSVRFFIFDTKSSQQKSISLEYFQETISKCLPDDFVNELQGIPQMISNLHQVISKCDTNSGELEVAVHKACETFFFFEWI